MKIADKNGNIYISNKSAEMVSAYLNNIVVEFGPIMDEADVVMLKYLSKKLWDKRNAWCNFWE